MNSSDSNKARNNRVYSESTEAQRGEMGVYGKQRCRTPNSNCCMETLPRAAPTGRITGADAVESGVHCQL